MSTIDDDWSEDSSSDSETSSETLSDSDSSDSYTLEFSPRRLTKVCEDEIWKVDSSSDDDDDVEKIDIVVHPPEQASNDKQQLLNCREDPESTISAIKVGMYMEISPISITIPKLVIEDETLPFESSHASGFPETGMNLLQIMKYSANEAAAAYFQKIPDFKSARGLSDQISQVPCINVNSEATREEEQLLQDLLEQIDEGDTSTNDGVEDYARNQDSAPTTDTGFTLNNITLQTSEQLPNNNNNTTEDLKEMKIDGETVYETTDMLEQGIKINANEAANNRQIIEELFNLLSS